MSRSNTNSPLEGPRWFQARAIMHGMKFYLETGMVVNTSYTPANMIRTAGHITGRTYPRGKAGMAAAIADLKEATS